MDKVDVWALIDNGDLPKLPVDNWIFYYDETNNIRKFQFKPESVGEFNVNDALCCDFILGGIALPPGVKPDICGLKKQLNIREDVELKSRALFRTGDFLYDMGSKQVTCFLKWMISNNIIIHYSSMNNLYDSLSDLVDETLITPGGKVVRSFRNEIFDSLFFFVMKHLDEFAIILQRNGYPDIDNEDVSIFCRSLADFILENESINDPSEFFLEIFRQNLRAAKDSEGLVFLKGGQKGVLVESYDSNYWYNMICLPNAYHIFDYESEIVKKFQNIDFVNHGVSYEGFEFKDSKEDSFIQISDLFIGLIGKFFCYVDSMFYQYGDKWKLPELNITQVHNFQMLEQVLSNTEKISPYLIRDECPDKVHENRFVVLSKLAHIHEK